MENNLTYEESIKRLNEIVDILEKNEESLDNALALYEEGTRLVAYCTKKLENAKQKITEIEKD